MKYDVSVLVPVYNVSQFIERSLHSLFSQTHQSIQFVFVDDCSPDNSFEILQKVLLLYPLRKNDVKIVKHEINRGLAAARNTGVENADGEYILHMDSDDYAELNMVEEMFLEAKKKNADTVISDFFLQWKKSTKYVHQVFSSDKEEYMEMLLNGSAMPAIWNKMFKRDIYIKNKIAAIAGINVGEDFSVTPKLIYHSDIIVKVNKAFVHYVQYNEGSYTNKISEKNIQDILVVINHLNKYFSKTPESSKMLGALKTGKLKKKVEFIKNIHSNGLNIVCEYFPDINDEANSTKLNFFDKLLLDLSSKNVRLLKIVLYGYNKIFSVTQFFKSR